MKYFINISMSQGDNQLICFFPVIFKFHFSMIRGVHMYMYEVNFSGKQTYDKT